MKRIVITGASGVIGTALLDNLRETGDAITAASRREAHFPPGVRHVKVGEVGAETDWRDALEGQDALVHLAALLPSPAHSPDDFDRVNAAGTARIVEQAERYGIKTIIFLSSIAVVTANANSVAVDDITPPNPANAYGRSKLRAEEAVMRFASIGRTGICLRPPLVYGAQSRGNWRAMMTLAASGLPLPFGAVDNRRTMISVGNLVGAIRHCLENASPERSGAYAVADRESVSLAQMFRDLREGMGRRPLLVPVPAPLLAVPLRLAGKGQIADSLFGDLEVDSSRFRDAFAWSPPESARDAIRRSGQEFAATRR
ncbi:NAD-dependent epimerase/dehydratase family protein [Aliihoeflea sp. 2WW]|uniref:NAD-dependent epimerase/dehydratase family protein n=1 Tax=Aliihoeflea sp. 2WW TaxID=1381123 RepID=UPI000465C3E5|nr:NAD-dependent epimerase/dehydratase family protein [Aliihoeflea sp. 2WW]